MEEISGNLDERLRAARGTGEFFVLLERESRERAAKARETESTSARIARRQGWLQIAPTPSTRHYVGGPPALNLECPWNRVADWHTSMWRAPPAEIEEKRLWVEAKA